MNDKKILIVSYLFPPIGGGGVIRVTKFTKYLVNFGWEPLVLTVKNAFYPLIDKSLLKELSMKAKIFRVQYFEPGFWFKNRWWQSFLNYLVYRWLFVPDERVLWLIPAAKKALEIVKKEDIKIIMTTSSPATDHLVGLIVKKITGIKWVADFRDEWANNPLRKFPTPLHRLIAKYLEKKVIENADWVISVSEPINRYLKSLSNQKKFSVITNGYDEEDFAEKLVLKRNNYCQLIYAGMIYNKNEIKFLQKALQELNLTNLNFDLLGPGNFLSHKEVIRKIRQADILVFILSKVDRPGVYTGKLFEYLAARRPILALAPQNTLAVKLIKKLKVGEVAQPDNVIEIKEKIINMYKKWLASRRSGPASPSQGGQKNELNISHYSLEKYTRKNLTKNLTKIFDKLTKKSKKIKLCLIGNIQSPQNQKLCHFFKKKNYEILFISTQPGKITGIKVYQLNRWSKELTPFYFIRSLVRIRKIINQFKPDIVHGQDLVFAGIWAFLSGFRPYAVTPWGSDVMLYDKFISTEKYLIKKTLHEANLVTVSSDALRKQAEKIGLDKDKAQMIHFGIDLEIFCKRSPVELKKKLKIKNEKVIFCPRAIAPIYNTDILIQAFDKILLKIPAKLILIENAADKKYLEEIQKLLEIKKLKDKAIFIKKASDREMAGLYNLADLVVSLTSSDGCSVSFLEAMACDKKIVVTDLPYIREWEKGGNIWKVPIRDVKTTAEVIIKVIKFPVSKWQKIGKNNRLMIARRAEVRSNFDKLDQLYRDLL